MYQFIHHTVTLCLFVLTAHRNMTLPEPLFTYIQCTVFFAYNLILIDPQVPEKRGLPTFCNNLFMKKCAVKVKDIFAFYTLCQH